MSSITVEASSLEDARALCLALSPFRPELAAELGDGYGVVIALRGSAPGRRVEDVLDAIEEYVSTQKRGPAHVELDGRRYTLASKDEVETVRVRHTPADTRRLE